MSVPKRGGSELRKLIEFAKELGFTCEITGSTHLVFRRPHTRAVWAAYTPSNCNARKFTRHDLTKAVREADDQPQTQRNAL
jgi:hypothetical protein